MKLSSLLDASFDEIRNGALAPVEVAILDTGIDGTHPDVACRITDSFQIVEDQGQYRASALKASDKNDRVGHGTAVASLVAGLAPNARLVDVRVFGPDDRSTGAALLAGLRMALLRRSSLISLGLACHAQFRVPLMELCDQAATQGQLLVAAARNMPLVDRGIPAQFYSCLGVESGRFGTPFRFSFRDGESIECAAQGERLRVATPGGGHVLQDGASYASAVMTGLCALLLGASPGLTPFEVKTVLKAWSVGLE